MIRSSLGVAKFTAILCSGSILRQEVATQKTVFFLGFFQAFFRDDAVVGFGLVYLVCMDGQCNFFRRQTSAN